MGRRKLLAVLALVASGCARQPAQCARPPDQIPVAPRAQQARRLVAALANGDGCHVKLRLPDASTGSTWLAERDAAVAAAQRAALACCASPQPRNLAAWPPAQTSFEVEFACPVP